LLFPYTESSLVRYRPILTPCPFITWTWLRYVRVFAVAKPSVCLFL